VIRVCAISWGVLILGTNGRPGTSEFGHSSWNQWDGRPPGDAGPRLAAFARFLIFLVGGFAQRMGFWVDVHVMGPGGFMLGGDAVLATIAL